LLAGYGYYHFSGAKTVVNAAHATKAQYQKLTQSLTESAPEPNEALDWLRKTSLSYAAFVPGAKPYVNSLFEDLDTVRKSHQGEVDAIVKETYSDIHTLTKKGDVSLETAQKAWSILERSLDKLGDLAGDSMSQIIDNHPQLKKMVGNNVDQLKNMGENYGEEAKKQVKETWSQVKDVTKNGFNADTMGKIRDIIQQSKDKLQKYGEDAYKKGMEELQPQLEKSPKLKEFVDKNKDKLMQGNLSELWDVLRKSADSGDTKAAEDFVKQTAQNTQQKIPGGFDQLLKMVPGGAKISSNMGQLQDIAHDHGEEAEKLVKDTWSDIEEVLRKRLDQAQKIKDKAESKIKN